MRFLATLLFIPTLLFTPSAQADQQFGVGIFTPELKFKNLAQRYALVRGVSQHLASTLGVKVGGRAYKSAKDFERDRRAKKVQFAILGASYLATGRRGRVLARARYRSAKAGYWTILTTKKTTIQALKGKRLQVPRLGRITVPLIENTILAGTLKVKTHFKVVQSPDVNSAISAVRLGKADATVGPAGSGLVPVLPGVTIPPPAFVVVDPKLPADVVKKVAAAITTFGAVIGPIGGWQSSGDGPYRQLAAASRKRVYRMRLLPVGLERLAVNRLVDVGLLTAKLPPLEELFWIP